jgi:uncharacterized protein (DUF488 family)
MITIHTLGHSNHTPATFLRLLKLHSITAVADVRSSPYSRFAPQFNRDSLEAILPKDGITYVFLGDQLGGRPADLSCYRDGAVSFGLLSSRPFFLQGLDRVRKGAAKFTLSLLCTEKDPILCHRMILVCRHLRSPETVIKHILEDGELEDNRDSERRLLQHLHVTPDDLFKTPIQVIEEAYDLQGQRIAYQADQSPESQEMAHG